MTGRLEIRTRKRIIAFSCDILKGSYYLVPTVRFDVSRQYWAIIILLLIFNIVMSSWIVTNNYENDL